jgi:hypothetical protein
MIASLVARRGARGGVYYGWWVVGVAFTSLFISGMTNGFTFSRLTLSAVCLCLAVSPLLAYVGAAVLGLAVCGNLVLQLQIWPEYFGRAAVGTIIGIGQLLQGITIAVIPLALAAVLDRIGSYPCCSAPSPPSSRLAYSCTSRWASRSGRSPEPPAW